MVQRAETEESGAKGRGQKKLVQRAEEETGAKGSEQKKVVQRAELIRKWCKRHRT